MSSLALIFVCLIAGIALRRSDRLPLGASQALNGYATQFALPALVLEQVHSFGRQGPFSPAVLLPALMPWVALGIAYLFFSALAKLFRFRTELVGALVLTAGFCNTSFVGFPLLEAIFGPQALTTGILIDQLGSFLCFSTVGLMLANFYAARAKAGENVGLSLVLRKLILFPPCLAMIAAFCLLPIEFPVWLSTLLSRLGSTLVPVALVSVGYQLKLNRSILRDRWKPLLLGLGYKLALVPALSWLIFVSLLGLNGEVAWVTIAQAAMAPMITSAAVAAECDLEPEFCGLMVGVGVPLSLLTVPAWAWLAQRLIA